MANGCNGSDDGAANDRNAPSKENNPKLTLFAKENSLQLWTTGAAAVFLAGCKIIELELKEKYDLKIMHV